MRVSQNQYEWEDMRDRTEQMTKTKQLLKWNVTAFINSRYSFNGFCETCVKDINILYYLDTKVNNERLKLIWNATSEFKPHKILIYMKNWCMTEITLKNIINAA